MRSGADEDVTVRLNGEIVAQNALQLPTSPNRPKSRNDVERKSQGMNVRASSPKLSVIVITPDTYSSVRTYVLSLAQQTVRHMIEVVLCAPDREKLNLDEDDLTAFAGYQTVEVGELTSSSVARTAGITVARAPVVALSEDHCFPDPAWAEAMINRHREPWSGVGPVIENANPQSTVSWANFIIEYGAWASPHPGGETHHISGHNSTYKRDALLEYGDRLSDILEAESPMQWDMRSRGHRFFVEPKAIVRHLNFSRLGASFALRFWGGRLFAANRAATWGFGKRVLYFVASPLIPIVRMVRAMRTLRRLRHGRRSPQLLATLVLFLILDGLGEAVGYLAGAGTAMTRLSDWGEFHRHRFLQPEEWHVATASFSSATRPTEDSHTAPTETP